MRNLLSMALSRTSSLGSLMAKPSTGVQLKLQNLQLWKLLLLCTKPVCGHYLMSSHRSHSGKLNISDRTGEWIATIKTNLKVVEVVLNVKTFESAIFQGEQLFADYRAIANPRPRCWQCIHWKLVKSECSLGFEEGKNSGGRFASQCSAFWPDDKSA